MKGKRPQYDLKNSKIYQTLKDANELASEVLKSFLRNNIFARQCLYVMVCLFLHAGEIQRRPEEDSQTCYGHGRVPVHAAQPEHKQAVQWCKSSAAGFISILSAQLYLTHHNKQSCCFHVIWQDPSIILTANIHLIDLLIIPGYHLVVTLIFLHLTTTSISL